MTTNQRRRPRPTKNKTIDDHDDDIDDDVVDDAAQDDDDDCRSKGKDYDRVRDEEAVDATCL